MSNQILDPGVDKDELPDPQDFSMLHMNGNLLCAIDVETTGLECGVHDVIELAIVPLNHLIEPFKKYKPLVMKIKPRRPENAVSRAMKKSGLTMTDIMMYGQDPWKAADIVEEWFEKLQLPVRHNIIPLAHNWPFDREFLIEWLGIKTFQYVFNGHYRDTMALAGFFNDRSYDQKKPYVYSKMGLEALCNRLGVDNKMPHRALYDCLATAEIYKKFVTQLHV
jgi:DNA polymerase III epsilon subunit-like protein